MLQAKFAVQIIAALALVLGIAGAGWKVRGWRDDVAISDLKTQHALDLKAISDQAVEAANEARKKELLWRDAVSQVDKLKGDLDNANSENARLRDSIGSGTKRVYVAAKCPASSGGVSNSPATAGVDNATGQAELDPAIAKSLVGIAGDGDSAIRQLTALQQYVTDVCLAKPSK